MKIRRATVEDAPLIADLNRHVHALHVANRPDLYRQDPPLQDLAAGYADRLGRDDAVAFVAELDDGDAVGYALAVIAHKDETTLFRRDSAIGLRQLAVDPRATRCGVATGLLDAVREAGRAAGCRRFVTEVWDFNVEARAFYEAAGFVPMTHALEQPL
ncbi:GNAT family N-acetyltransferase [Nonomuraea muscovyensis]|uniref:GNAT family N-acetyltransferase n=1 Tax=Nonomuraea muscovyensis TaxID=1124761 RepID=UPI0033D79E2A